MSAFNRTFFILFVSYLLLSCSIANQSQIAPKELTIDSKLLATLPTKKISYQQTIKPILGSRCVVCHGCYDAPCQLKLSSIEGIQRGATKKTIYASPRIIEADPTRLFIDAQSISQWRQKGFFSVLNEDTLVSKPTNSSSNLADIINKQATQTTTLDNNLADNKSSENWSFENHSSENNLRYSLLYHMLQLKQNHPQAPTGKLDPGINLDIYAKQQCATLGEFSDFADNHPGWGMPYGLPNLTQQEYNLLVQWIAQGSPAEPIKALHKTIVNEIKRWEDFFNQPGLKNQLVSRYLFEHLFLANLYFTGLSHDLTNSQTGFSFFRLLRSSTPPGQAIKEIVTIRPYDSPGEQKFYYRLKHQYPQTVIKNHNSYPLSIKKLHRFNQLFIEPDYQVNQLPSYKAIIASNPFKVFQDIPPVSRYQFLLDNTHFFIQGFIKGPVCRGQISLNVIDDYFWVVFINPQSKVNSLDSDFLKQNLNYFQLPADKENTFDILSLWTRYWSKQKKYIRAKIKNFKEIPEMSLDQSMAYIYTGIDTNVDSDVDSHIQSNIGSSNIEEDDENTENAALTIFRHFDSASVSYGLIGNGPNTTWVVDYPILERIHYLLVAGFDVYGNTGHQLNTRIYMDFLRMEGEDNFLAFLPVSARKSIRDNWYRGIREKVGKLFQAPMDWLSITSVHGYKTKQPKLELYEKLKQHLKFTQLAANKENHGLISTSKNNYAKSLSLENSSLKYRVSDQNDQKIRQFMQQVNALRGEKMSLIPDITFLRIKMKDSNPDRAFTIINNKAYKHVTSLFEDETKTIQRDYQYDTLSIVDWLEGSYPNFFLDVNMDELDHFTEQFVAISDTHDYEQFIAQYGIRRTNAKFWELSDWFIGYYKKAHPVKAGYFDLNRYQNK